jgi:ketosteroid isomerase-like protein
MNLPSPIQAYFDADRTGDGETLVRAFAPDAVVEDEGHSYAGHQAIGAWWRETKEKYRTVMEPLEISEEDDVTKVIARVTGHFPGSPAMIKFAFRLNGDQITKLEITA